MNRLVLALAVLMATSVTAATGDYLMHARVSYTDGGAMIKGSSDSDWSYASVNTLVFQGDTLWLDSEGALEVEFSGGSFARVADGSKVEAGAAILCTGFTHFDSSNKPEWGFGTFADVVTTTQVEHIVDAIMLPLLRNPAQVETTV